MAVRTDMGKDERGNPLNRARRRKFLLSGLLNCDCCGAPYAILAQDRNGCANRRSKGTCGNARTINRRQIEDRVLAALQSRMLTPDLVAHFIKTFETEMIRHQRESGATTARLRTQLSSVERRLQGALQAIENGAWNDSLNQRLNELEAEKRQLQAQLTSTDTSHNTVRLHPNAAALYAAKVADLQAALNDAAIRAEAAEAIGGLIEKVVLTPDDTAPDGLAAELHGDLAMILNLAASSAGSANTKNPRTNVVSEGLLSVVAGARYHLYRTRLSALPGR
jgi:site-specific DNA recombinase